MSKPIQAINVDKIEHGDSCLMCKKALYVDVVIIVDIFISQ